MKAFLKVFFGSCLGTFITLWSFAFIAFIAIAALAGFAVQEAQKQSAEAQPSDNTILKLSFSSGLVEHQSENPMDRIDLNNFKLKDQLALDSLILSLEEAKTDDRIDGLYLDLKGSPGRWSQMSEIRRAIEDFKSSGKFVLAYGETYSTVFYYLASSADEVWMNPLGDIELSGIGMDVLFLSRLLKAWDVEVEVFKGEGNDYKSALEPLVLEKLSTENREQLERYVQQLWEAIRLAIEKGRSFEAGSMEEMVKNFQPTSANVAFDLGLIDRVGYEGEASANLSFRAGGHGKGCTCTDIMDIKDYAKAMDLLPLPNMDDTFDDGVGLLFAEGSIVSDEMDDETTISPSELRHQLQRFEDDDNIQALVLRINSPGGSALASESLWRDIQSFTREKPVVISFGPMAASGGYYMACGANLIVAEPLTLTGSIGVFGLIPRVDQLLAQHLDITVDHIHTHPELGGDGVLQSLGELKRKDIQKSIDRIYRTFLQRVAEGRQMTVEAVHEVAKGRIWIGRDAVTAGLVDELGGLNFAIARAKAMVGLENDAPVSILDGGPEWKRLLTSLGELRVQAWPFSNSVENSIQGQMLQRVQHLKPVMQSLQSRKVEALALLPLFHLHPQGP